MLRPISRCAALLAMLLSQAACGDANGDHFQPNAESNVSGPVVAAQMLASTVSFGSNDTRLQTLSVGVEAVRPCIIPGIWHFKGACVKKMVGPKATKICLLPYKGSSLTIVTGISNITKSTPFIVGTGTGKADITGRLNDVPFLFYGSACASTTGKIIKCSGKALLYYMFFNAGSTEVAFTSSPAITLATKTLSQAKACQLSVLSVLTSNNQIVWVLLPVSAPLKNGKLQLPASAGSNWELDAQRFFVFAVSCS